MVGWERGFVRVLGDVSMVCVPLRLRDMRSSR